MSESKRHLYTVSSVDKIVAVIVIYFSISSFLRVITFTFTFTHLADAFIQSDLQCIQVIHVLSLCVFPGNRTHNLLRC